MSEIKTKVETQIGKRLNRSSAAAYLGLQPKTLAMWASNGRHKSELPFYKIGRVVYYLIDDLDKFIASVRVGGV
jgi:hypothetical protein